MRANAEEVAREVAVIAQKGEIVALRLVDQGVQPIGVIDLHGATIIRAVAIHVVEAQPAVVRYAATNAASAIAVNQDHARVLSLLARPLDFARGPFFRRHGLARMDPLSAGEFAPTFVDLRPPRVVFLLRFLHQFRQTLTALRLFETDGFLALKFALMARPFLFRHVFSVSAHPLVYHLVVATPTALPRFAPCDAECGRLARTIAEVA